MQIKPGLGKKYKEYLINNINSLFEEPEIINGKKMPKMPSSYIFAILLATELIGEALDEGCKCEDAEKEMNGLHLTGFMAGVAVESVVDFNPRGEEFRKYWNTQWGVKPEDDQGGTVNPAIVTFEPKKQKAD